jgi:hypothetical protein
MLIGANLPGTGAINPQKVAAGLPTVWTQWREAAGGRSERAALHGNRAS